MNDKCPKCGAESWTEFSWQCSSSKNGNYIAPWCRIRELEAIVAERDATIAGLEEEARLWERLARATKDEFGDYVFDAYRLRNWCGIAAWKNGEIGTTIEPFRTIIEAMRQIETWEREDAT